eukprot:702496-Prymnesium_polylepis.1
MLLTLLPSVFLEGGNKADGSHQPGLVQFLNMRFSGKDKSHQHRKTTTGEVLRQYGYILALCLETGRPLDEMLEDTAKE